MSCRPRAFWAGHVHEGWTKAMLESVAAAGSTSSNAALPFGLFPMRVCDPYQKMAREASIWSRTFSRTTDGNVCCKARD